MASRSELVAITSSGISYYRILFVPYFISAFLLMGAQLYANHYLVPKANQGLLEYEQKHSNKRLDRKQDNVNMQLNADTYLTFKSYNPKDSLGKNMALEIFDGNELSKKVIAERAKWVGKEKKWELQKYYIREFVGEEEKLTHGDKKLMALELAPNDFDKNMYLKDAMPTSELNKLIEKEKLRGSNNLPFLLIEKHKRTAMPFATLILTLIGYSIASRKTRGGLGLHILTGIAISSVFVIMAQFSTTFATNGNFSPLVAVWMPNIIFAFIGLIVVYLAPK